MNEKELFDVSDYDLNHNYNNKNDPYFDEKVQHEVHRIMGLLRFSPDENGVYTAKCAPDYFVLPALETFFTARFGETPWEIIDEKRGLSLSRKPPEKVKLVRVEDRSLAGTENKLLGDKKALTDQWEGLWKHYHKTINNESRDNPNLQRQFMPQRYWKYLPEKNL